MSRETRWSPGTIGIIGSGSWATALAKIVIDTQGSVNWYFRFKDTVRQFKAERHNPSYLTNLIFDTSQIDFFTDIPTIIEQSDTIITVTPSPYIKNIFNKIKPEMLKGKFILNAIKGIVPEDNILISDYLMREFGVPENMIGIISGPCHAEEVALDRLSYLTLGCTDIYKAKRLLSVFKTSNIQCHVGNDIVGIEYASVLKNVYAIAAGICQGMRYGDNFQAVLVSNALSEMSRFVEKVEESNRNISDSVYLGDLLVTAYSRYSRNRTFGTMIGKGYSVKQAQLEMEMTAEGYYGAKCIHQVNKTYQVDMPIAETIYKILYKWEDPKKAIFQLSEVLR